MTRIRYDGQREASRTLSPPIRGLPCLSSPPYCDPFIGRRPNRAAGRMATLAIVTAHHARTKRLESATLYLCTDARREHGDLAEFVDAALAGGVDIVQLLSLIHI